MFDREKLINEQLSYAETDTVCFFAPNGDGLREMQEKEWSPVIAWINKAGCDFKVSEGFEVHSLTERTKNFLKARLDAFPDEELDLFCAVSGGCRSVILALAVTDGFLTPERAFETAILEERYHALFWADDEDARISREGRKDAVLKAAEKLKGCQNG